MPTDRENDLSDRTIKANDRPVLIDGAYILVVLNRALRGEDNPVIDAASVRAAELYLPLVVYSELNTTVNYASERLCYFILGAFKELAISLSKRNIPCVQTIKNANSEEILRPLCLKAAAIYTDEDYVHWDKAKIQRILDVATSAVFFVDAYSTRTY